MSKMLEQPLLFALIRSKVCPSTDHKMDMHNSRSSVAMVEANFVAWKIGQSQKNGN